MRKRLTFRARKQITASVGEPTLLNLTQIKHRFSPTIVTDGQVTLTLLNNCSHDKPLKALLGGGLILVRPRLLCIQIRLSQQLLEITRMLPHSLSYSGPANRS